MKQKVTINDIALRCHVSKSSVSRYLNHGYVSKENAEKIRQAIEETGFETNFFASRLKSKRSRLIGIMVSNITKYDTARTLRGMQRKLDEKGYQGVILLSEYDVEKEKTCINNFAQQGVDGIILEACDHVEELQAQVEKYEVPVLFANRTCLYAPFLSLEQGKAGTMMGQLLQSKNYQKIAYLQNDPQIGKARKESFLNVYKEKGEVCDFQVLPCDGTLQNAYENAARIVEGKFDAVVCEKDEYALSVLKYFHEVHIHVPQNIGIASFGGNDIVSMTAPGITSVAFSYEAFGANLVEEIIAVIESGIPKWEDAPILLQERESLKTL